MATAAKLEVRAPGPTTAEELLAWPDAPPGEIVDGVWVPKYKEGEVTGTSAPHAVVAMEIGYLLKHHVRQRGLGWVFAAEAGFRLRRSPDLLRCPDAAFVSAARLPEGIPAGVIDGAPDLAVEVLSPSNTASEMQRKLVDYLRYGSKAVWVVDTGARSVAVHPAGALPRLLEGDDPLEGGDVLPGFSVPASALFVDLGPLAPGAARA